MMKRLSMFVALACLGLALPMYAQDEATTLADGDYVLQNVESSLYLAGGNAWGTEATLLSTPVVFTLTAVEGEADTYTLTSELYATNDVAGGIYFAGSDFYVDGTAASLTIKEGTDENAGTYTILCPYTATVDGVETTTNYYLSNSTDGSNGDVVANPTEVSEGTGCYWKFINVDDLPSLQASAFEGTQVDVTAYLKNPSFSVDAAPVQNTNSDITWSYTWTANSELDNGYAGNYTYIFDGADNVKYGMLERWHAEDGYDLYQTLTGLPAGHYTLTAQAFQGAEADYSQRFYLYAGDNQTILPDDNGNAVANSGENYTTSNAATYKAFLGGETYAVSVEFDVESADDEVKVGISDFYEKVNDADGYSISWCVVAGLFNLYYDGQLKDDDEYADGDEVEIDGTTVTVKSENLIKNGGFNFGVDAWTAGGYTKAATIENTENPNEPYFTITSTGGYNDGAYITTNGSSSNSEKTLTQHIGVEAGKSYLFVCYTSGTTPENSNLAYNALFVMSSETSEVTYQNLSSSNEYEGSTYGVVCTEFNWGAAASETATDWTRTAVAFTATTDHVGIRLGYNSSTKFDGFQLYEIDVPEFTDEELEEGDLVTVDGNVYSVKDGENLVKNGSFNEFDDGISDWKTNNDYTTDIDAKYILISPLGGFNGGAYITPMHYTSSVQNNIFAAPCQAIEVKAGSTYLFIGYTNATSSSDFRALRSMTYSKDDSKYTEKAVLKQMSASTDGDWAKTEYVFTVPGEDDAENTYSYVGIRCTWSDGISFDGFQLYEVEESEDYDIDAVKAALDEVTVPEANIGTEAFQYDPDAVAALSEAYNAAKAMVDAATTDDTTDNTDTDNTDTQTETEAVTYTSADCYDAIVALQEAAAQAAVLNAPALGQTFHIIMLDVDNSIYEDNQEDSTVVQGKAVQFSTNADTEGGYSLQFTAVPNNNRPDQVFSFTPVEYEDDDEDALVNAYTISFGDTDRTFHYLCTGTKAGTSASKEQDQTDYANSQIRSTTTADDALTVVVSASTTEEGYWKLLNTEANANLGINAGTDHSHALFTNTDDTKSDLGLVCADTIEWTLSDDYGTLVLPFAPTEDEIEDLTFYSTEAYDSLTVLTLVEVDAEDIEANTPYIVSGEADTYKFHVTDRTFSATSEASGWLTGVYESTTVDKESYVLQNQDDLLAFYLVSTGDITLEPNHCFLTVSETTDDTTTDTTADVPAVILLFPNGDGNATAITGVEANVVDAEAIYDLSGRKVSRPQHGIYIKGGKKVVIK